MIVPRSLIYVALTLGLVSACFGQDWATFQKKHVLNPTASGETGYATWNRTSWNSWLKTRIPSDYGTKSVNSVVVSAPTDLLKEFSTSNPSHNAGPDFHWSKTKLKTYVMNLVTSTKTYDAYNCNTLFVLARLDSSQRPMHYHGYASTQLASGTLPLNLGSCTKIN